MIPHTTPDGHLVNFYGRAIGTAAQVPKALRHDHLLGDKGYCNAQVIRHGTGPLWICEGAFDALSLLAAGIRRVVALFGVHGWHWGWVREICELVFALDADAPGQQQWRLLARQAVLRGKRVTFLPPEAYGGQVDVNAAWVAGTLQLKPSLPLDNSPEADACASDNHERWEERAAIVEWDGGLSRSAAERVAWERCFGNKDRLGSGRF